jgi:hypothetical protein
MKSRQSKKRKKTISMLIVKLCVNTKTIFTQLLRWKLKKVNKMRNPLGVGSGRVGRGFEQNRCLSVENKFTDYLSANRPLIGSGGRVG